MPRPKRNRRMCNPPKMMGFTPYGMPEIIGEAEVLLFDEYESIRLLDYEQLTQEQAALRMNVSQPTLTRIYEKARKTIAKCLIEGKSICISGGQVEFDKEWFRCRKCCKLIEGIESHTRCNDCNSYGSEELVRL